MATLEQILGYRNLSGVIQSIKSGVPNPLPAELFRVGKKTSGNRAEYFKITGTRKVAHAVQYGAPARRRDLREIDLVPVTMIHSFESQQWPLALTLALTKMTDLSKDTLGEQQAEYWSREFKRQFSNLRVVATACALFKGKILWASDGNVADPTSTAGAYTYSTDFSVPAANQGVLSTILNAFNNNTYSAWTDTSANIITQLQILQKIALQKTGYPLEVAYYGTAVPECIGANTTAQQYLKLNPRMNDEFIQSGVVPNGFGGIKRWIPVGEMFYDTSDGTHVQLVSDHDITFTPQVDVEWWDTHEGSFPVPRTVLPQMGADAAQMLANVAEQFGMFGYGQLSLNPPCVEQYAGDTFIPLLKVPAAVFQVNVAAAVNTVARVATPILRVKAAPKGTE